MGKMVMGIGKVFSCFINNTTQASSCSSRSTNSNSCLWLEIEQSGSDLDQKQPLMAKQTTTSSSSSDQLRLRPFKDHVDVMAHQNPTLALHFNPKVVVVRVSMHCNGCARRVEKHISKIEGVDSYEVDMEREMVVVTGDVFPFEVMQCISKVKSVEILDSQD